MITALATQGKPSTLLQVKASLGSTFFDLEIPMAPSQPHSHVPINPGFDPEIYNSAGPLMSNFQSSVFKAKERIRRSFLLLFHDPRLLVLTPRCSDSEAWSSRFLPLICKPSTAQRDAGLGGGGTPHGKYTVYVHLPSIYVFYVQIRWNLLHETQTNGGGGVKTTGKA